MQAQRSVLEGWPTLMSRETAARYLSLDEALFQQAAARFDVQPVEPVLGVHRWRKADLDALVKRLPTMRSSPRSSNNGNAGNVDQASIDQIAEAVAHRLGKSTPVGSGALVSISEASKLLGVGRTMIYSMIASERLATRHIGWRTLIPRSSIEAILTG